MPSNDPNDPGFVLDEQSLRRMIRGVLRTEMAPYNNIPEDPYRTRKVNDKFRMIRGQSTAIQSGRVITIDHVVKLCGGIDPSYGDLTATVKIANTIFPRSYIDDEWIDAVFSPNVIAATDPDAGGVQIDWETLNTGTGTSSTPFRRFELASGKFSVNPTVPVYWLDFSENITANTGTVYDPEALFTGRAAGYYSSDTHVNGFRGIAELRSELAGVTGTDQRWEIIQMEGFARWVIARYYQNGTATAEWRFEGVYTTIDHWDRKPPTGLNGTLNVNAFLGLIQPTSGDRVLLMLLNADGNGVNWFPSYIPVSASRAGTFLNASFYTAHIPAAIAAGAAATPTRGTGIIYAVFADGSTSLVGTHNLYNPYQIRALGDCACALLAGTSTGTFAGTGITDLNLSFLITGPPLHECSLAVVTDANCGTGTSTGHLILTKHTVPYLAVECGT